jgi:4-diphosphocytidyl-2-C-methyl-D-erythritol kinase
MKAYPKEILSYAKLNLFLNIKSKRDDGYHEIDSIFQTIDIADKLRIEEGSGKSDEIRFSVPLDAKRSSLHKTLELVREFAEKRNKAIPPLSIFVDKKIPAGSGLGGASSNAAALLEFLDKHFELKMSDEEKFSIAAEIGSDVPFFLYGGLCRVSGRGERVEKINGRLKTEFIIVFPGESVNTGRAYELWDRFGRPEEVDLERALKMIKSGVFLKGLSLYNSFESVLPILSTRAYEALEMLSRIGFPACLSGSGSAVFAPVKDTKNIDTKILFELNEKGFNIFFAKPVEQGAVEIS